MLIVDRDILVRRAITNILDRSDIFEVCWLADGCEQIEDYLRENYPDVVLLNIDSMQSPGLTILSKLRINFSNIPVIAVTPRNEEGAEAAISALQLGAVDFISKPAHKNLILFAEGHLQKRLVPIIKAAKKIREREYMDQEILDSLTHPQKTFENVNNDPQSTSRTELVVMGGCTGGTQALFPLVGALPANLDVPVVIVQHLPRMYTKYLAQKLDAVSDTNVREVADGTLLDSGGVWIAPGGYQCEVGLSGYQKVLNIHRGMRENNMRPSIDILFRSAAKVFAKKAMGVLLSGCGYDGLSGAEEIRNAGGQILAQDPRTAVASELPLAVIRNGLTREYFSPEELARQIVLRAAPAAESESMDMEGASTTGNTLFF